MLFKVFVLLFCVVGALSSFIRIDTRRPQCPIDLEYDPKLNECVDPIMQKDPLDYDSLYDDITEKTVETVTVKKVNPEDFY